MATLPAALFVDLKPSGADSGPTVVGDTQVNLQALRDAVILGAFHGWNVVNEFDATYTDEIYRVTHTKGTEKLRAIYTWQLSSGTRRVQNIAYRYSSDNGVSYTAQIYWTPTYAGAADHRITSEAWT